jgi:hypothetical protein
VSEQPKKRSDRPASGQAHWKPLPGRADRPQLSAEQEAMVREYIADYGRFVHERYRDLHSQ